jgi:prepilin peptidase CpaA
MEAAHARPLLEMMTQILSWLLPVGLACAGVIDLRTRRVPNRISFSITTLGLLANVASGGWDGARQSALGWLVGFLVLVVPFVFGTMGAGDVKLLAAIGAWKGPQFVVAAAACACVVGGLWAIVYLLRRRPTTSERRQAKLPFAPSMVIGTYLAAVFQRLAFAT